MSQVLADLLLAEQPLFTQAIRQLEKESGNPSADVALIGEMQEKYHDRVSQLGLDPNDSTAREVHSALINRVKEDNIRLAKMLGSDDEADVEFLVPKIIEYVDKLDTFPKTVWVLKKTVAKDMLISKPPKNIMKHLGYRSVKSMLRTENLFEVYGALRFAEDAEWLNDFNELYKDLKPTDFTTRKIEMVTMSDKWLKAAEPFIKKKFHNITHLKELGVVMILPMKTKKMPGIVLKDLSLLLHYHNEIRLYSAFFKLIQMKKNFGQQFVDTLIADPDLSSIRVGGQTIHWRVIQRYFGKLGKEEHPESFQPHLHPEDLHWRKAEEIMYEFDEKLEFWKEMDYVGKILDGDTITFNFMDIAFGYSNSVSFDKRYLYHFREALWNEIFERYMGEKNLEEQLLTQLDNDMVAPEKLVVER